MDSVKNFYHSFHKVTEDDFSKQGYLSKEQFLKSGDQLNKTGWKWKPSQSKYRQFSEESKQYLSCQATSQRRIKSMQTLQQVVNEDGFVETSWPEGEQDVLEQDIRQYSLSITYDDYYHSPRMWLSAVDIDNRPLSAQQIFEDVMGEYQNETVTYGAHPFLPGSQQVSIHPCKHASVFKLFIEMAQHNEHEIQAYQALFIFLKFISSVIPTIEYDTTLDVNM